MKIPGEVYLVGGAVRDELLGRPVGDRDWVVVGTTPEAMLQAGFEQVGRDFPVFLHPQTHEEYALARTERKVGAGHLGFVCHAGVDVTLEEDLERRDLTVNAIARTAAGDLVDPYGGVADLRAARLRHVSDAFAEDPLRILRAARFAAQLDFQIVAETRTLLADMAAAGALDELPAERVWQELHKTLVRSDGARFFAELAAVDALRPWFGELEALDAAPRLPGDGALARFAALGLLLPTAAVAALATRLKAPLRYQRLALLLAEEGERLGDWPGAVPEALLGALQTAGVLQKSATERLEDLGTALALVEAPAPERLLDLSARVAALGARDVQPPVEPGPELGRAIQALRLEAIAAALA
ncbi:MAG: hypothetical protein AAF515_15540 [Pseudomonadota bacterium]